MRAPDLWSGRRVVRPAANAAATNAATTGGAAATVQRRADQPARRSDRALSRQSAWSGSRGLDVSARNRGGGALGTVQQERDRASARRGHAAAGLGRERQSALRGPAGAGDDEREARVDPAARRRLSVTAR